MGLTKTAGLKLAGPNLDRERERLRDDELEDEDRVLRRRRWRSSRRALELLRLLDLQLKTKTMPIIRSTFFQSTNGGNRHQIKKPSIRTLNAFLFLNLPTTIRK